MLLQTQRLLEKKRRLSDAGAFLESTRLSNGPVPELKGETFAAILRRPEYGIHDILAMLPEGSPFEAVCQDNDFLAAIELEIKYAGYIARQRQRAEQMVRLEGRRIPHGIDYQKIRALSAEGREKLARYRPLTLGQAGRIAGVSPADVAVLMIHLKKQRTG